MRRNRVGDTTNVFANGCLIHLNIRKWGATSRVVKDQFDFVYRDDVPVDVVRSVYDLLSDCPELEEVNSVVGEAKRFVYQHSLPFPVDGIVFVHKMDIEKVHQGLTERKQDFSARVDALCRVYDSKREEYKTKYPQLYRPEKYPRVEALRTKFVFQWSFRHFTVPDAEMGILPPEVYAEEHRKVKAEAQQAKDIIVSVIAQTFKARIDALNKQCSGSRICSVTVENLQQYIERFNEVLSGLVNHRQLNDLVGTCKLYLEGIGAEELRVDGDFRSMVSKKMEKVSEAFGKIATSRPHRSISF